MIQFSIKNKLAIWLLTFIVVVAGIYAGVDIMKKGDAAQLLIIRSLRSQRFILEPLHRKWLKKLRSRSKPALKISKRIKNVISTSAANISSIQVEYEDFDQDMDQAVNDIKMEIDKIGFAGKHSSSLRSPKSILMTSQFWD